MVSREVVDFDRQARELRELQGEQIRGDQSLHRLPTIRTRFVSPRRLTPDHHPRALRKPRGPAPEGRRSGDGVGGEPRLPGLARAGASAHLSAEPMVRNGEVVRPAASLPPAGGHPIRTSTQPRRRRRRRRRRVVLSQPWNSLRISCEFWLATLSACTPSCCCVCRALRRVEASLRSASTNEPTPVVRESDSAPV